MVLALILSLQVTAKADCVSDCNAALRKADQVIADKQHTIDLQDKALADCRSDNTNLQLSLTQRIDSDSNILKNPWFDGALGVIAGVVLMSFAGRR